MFATLIIALPSVHEGGELVVRHKDREVCLDFRCDDPSELAFAAFYADCVHDVRPLHSGHRLVLVYNLCRRGKGRRPTPPDYSRQRASIAESLHAWTQSLAASDDIEPDDAPPQKLVYPLEHAYTPAELAWHALKGADAAAAAVLIEATRSADCDLHLALMRIEEYGSAEHTDCAPRHYRGRWYGHDDDGDDIEDADGFEVLEIDERHFTLSHWGQTDGTPGHLGNLPFTEDELSPPEAIETLAPDETHFHEATGNEGASFERTYSRAALVVWPSQRRLAVMNQGGLKATLPHLEFLTSRWLKERPHQNPASDKYDHPDWKEAHELSQRMIKT